MKRFLITGAAGFIGYHLCESLLGATVDTGSEVMEPVEVIGIDSVNDAYDPRLKEWRLAQLTRYSGFRFVRGNITDPDCIECCFSDGSAPDAIIHLAARAGVRESVTDPWIYYSTNVTGTLHLLEFCRNRGVRKFVMASSSSVYGAAAIQPQSESHCTDFPCSPYAASKKSAEVTAHAWHSLHGLDVSALRFFTVYGPAGRPDMSIFHFIRNISERRPITLYGDGRQSRDFTYVGDIVRGIRAALRPVGYRIFNLGGDHPIVLNDVIAGIVRRIGHEPIVNYQPVHPADIPATWADISRARTELGWEPQTSMNEGLDRCVEWYREHRDILEPS